NRRRPAAHLRCVDDVSATPGCGARCVWLDSRDRRRAQKQARSVSKPASGNWTNLTRPPVTVREHHDAASCGVAAPGRQFSKPVNGSLAGPEGGPISASQSAEVE